MSVCSENPGTSASSEQKQGLLCPGKMFGADSPGARSMCSELNIYCRGRSCCWNALFKIKTNIF